MKGWGPGHLPNRHEALVLSPAKRQKRKKGKRKEKEKQDQNNLWCWRASSVKLLALA